MPLTLEYSRQVVRFMDKLERAKNADWRKIWSRIEYLTNAPKPPQALRVSGYTAGIYRIRVGDYRVIYTFDDKTLRIGIIERRNKAYQLLRTNIRTGIWQP